MSPKLQAKLLRFLQEKKIQRIGGGNEIEIDTRVIAATNVDLNNAMKVKKFRDDLFFRISVISINVPPLRKRGDDIKLLANAFLERYNIMFNKKIMGFSPDASDEIEKYSWPGNVRELENKLQKALITSESNIIEPFNLGFGKRSDKKASNGKTVKRFQGITLKEARKRLEMELVESTVVRHKGNIKRAAEELGISRPTLYDLIDKYKVTIKDDTK
jgi:two-component system NtrC family response regulator